MTIAREIDDLLTEAELTLRRGERLASAGIPCPACGATGSEPVNGARCSSCSGTGVTQRLICIVCGKPEGHILEEGHCYRRGHGRSEPRHHKGGAKYSKDIPEAM